MRLCRSDLRSRGSVRGLDARVSVDKRLGKRCSHHQDGLGGLEERRRVAEFHGLEYSAVCESKESWSPAQPNPPPATCQQYLAKYAHLVAFGLGDASLTCPSAGTFVHEMQKASVIAFLAGIRGPPAPVLPVYFPIIFWCIAMSRLTRSAWARIRAESC